MIRKRWAFKKKAIQIIGCLARYNKVYAKLSDDVTQIIFNYIPGKDGSLILKPNEIVSLKSDIQYEFDDIKIPFSSHLKVKIWDTTNLKGGRLIIHCFKNLIIDSGGSIDCSKCGYLGGKSGLCCGESYDHNGAFNKSTGKSYPYGYGGGGICAGGASYGTDGQNGYIHKNKKIINNDNDIDYDNENMKIGVAGKIYGDGRITKMYLGSGGGSSFWCGGGKGGGAAYIFTNNLINNGLISCNGGNGTEHGSGGGSGGSILLDIIGEKQCKLGKIQSGGGIGKKLKGSFKSKGGNGGNGRICINNKMLMVSSDNDTAEYTKYIFPKPYICWSYRIDGNQYMLPI